MTMKQIVHPHGNVDLLGITGRIILQHYVHKEGIWREESAKENTIYTSYKNIIRDNLHSAADFAMDNLFGVDGQQEGGAGHAGGDPVGKDGILVYDSTNDKYLTLITVVHPTDPSGDYYRQWRGTLTNNDGAGIFNAGVLGGTGAIMGVNLQNIFLFGYPYANQSFDVVTLAVDDILSVDWKISLS